MLTQVVFPTDKERIIPAESLLQHSSFEEDASAYNKIIAMFFRKYIKEIEVKKAGSEHVCNNFF